MNYFLQTQITRYTVRRLPLIMDVRMHDNGYVRLTALPTGILLFSPTLRIGLNYLALSGLLQRSAVSPANSPPLKGGWGDVPLHSDTVYPA